MATRKTCNGKSKTVTNKNGSTRSYSKTSAGKWKLCGWSGKAPKKRKK